MKAKRIVVEGPREKLEANLQEIAKEYPLIEPSIEGFSSVPIPTKSLQGTGLVLVHTAIVKVYEEN